MGRGNRSLGFRGQAGLEQMLVAAVGIAVIILVFALAYSYSNDNVKTSQGKDAADKIAKAADYINLLGTDSRTTVEINMPTGVRFVNVSGNRLHFRIALSSGEADIFVNTQANLSGTVPVIPGGQRVVVTSLGSNMVLIGTDYLSCTPQFLTKSVEQGNSSSANVTITNNANFQLSGISASKTGGGADMMAIAQQPPASLGAGASGNVELGFAVPEEKPVESYSAILIANGSNSSICTSSITIFVTRKGGPDTAGPNVTSISYAPTNPDVNSTVRIAARGSDAPSGNSPIKDCQLSLDDGVSLWNAMAASDGAYDESVEDVDACAAYQCGKLTLGLHTVYARCTDTADNVGPAKNLTLNVVLSADDTGPIVTYLNWTPQAPTNTTPVTIIAIGNDTATEGSNISMCIISNDSGTTWRNMNAVGSAYNTRVVQAVNYSMGVLKSGKYNVSVKCNDSYNNWGNVTNATFEVTDIDSVGPIVTYLNISPAAPNTTSYIVVNATGSDVGRGGSAISTCQVMVEIPATGGIDIVPIDASSRKAVQFAAKSHARFAERVIDTGNITDPGGNQSNGTPAVTIIPWTNMNASDGLYSSPVENVSYVANVTIDAGNYTLSVRCNDSWGNMGPVRNATLRVVKVDIIGPNVTYLNVTPFAPTTAGATIVNATADDSATGRSNIAMCLLSSDSGVTWKTMNATDNSYNSQVEKAYYSFGVLPVGDYNVSVKCNDSSGNVGAERNLSFAVKDGIGPNVTYLNITPLAPNLTSVIVINATANDSLTGRSNISVCNISFDSGAWSRLAPGDGSYDSVAEKMNYTVGPFGVAGNHSVAVRCNDSAGAWGPARSMNFTVRDTIGPNVTAIAISPSQPTNRDSLNVTAIASDVGSGGAAVTACRIWIDSAGYYSMAASDGSYNSATENVKHSIGYLTPGNHTVYINCSDSAGNWGKTGNLTFSVVWGYVKEILFVRSIPIYDDETAWSNWIGSHQSDEFDSWSYDVVTTTAVESGAVSLSDYRIIVSPSRVSDSGFWNKMATVRSTTGSYVVLLGYALRYGMVGIGAASQTGTVSTYADEVKISTSNSYITSDYLPGDFHTLTTSAASVGWNDNLYSSARTLATVENDPKPTLVDETSKKVLAFGIIEGGALTAEGTVMATRVLDYALLQSGWRKAPSASGPAVSNVAVSANPTYGQPVTITASASDATGVAKCQVSLDSGGWRSMNAVDGSYGGASENVRYQYSTITEGAHTAEVRCIDAASNLGNSASTSFTVAPGYFKNILFVQSASPTGFEVSWRNWIASNNPGTWNYDTATTAEVEQGLKDINNYRILVTAYGGSDNGFWNKMGTFKATGRYVVLLGYGGRYGPYKIGATNQYTTNIDSGSNEMRIATAHYITSGFTPNSIYTVTTGTESFIWNSVTGGTHLAWVENTNTEATIVDDAADKLLIFGPVDADLLNANGDLLAARVIDHAIQNSN